jgi:hypothetical protein
MEYEDHEITRAQMLAALKPLGIQLNWNSPRTGCWTVATPEHTLVSSPVGVKGGSYRRLIAEPTWHLDDDLTEDIAEQVAALWW